MKFCQYCGKQLADNEECTCHQNASQGQQQSGTAYSQSVNGQYNASQSQDATQQNVAGQQNTQGQYEIQPDSRIHRGSMVIQPDSTMHRGSMVIQPDSTMHKGSMVMQQDSIVHRDSSIIPHRINIQVRISSQKRTRQ